MSEVFPDPYEIFDPDGLALISEDLTNDMLIEAYSKGIFPWPYDETPVLWFCPENRGIIRFEDLHISRSLKKDLQKQNWTFTVNKQFEQVISECAQTKRKNQDGTWITQFLLNAYLQFKNTGHLYSVECLDENQNLIGGIYGVFVDGIFSGESMFYKQSNASKASLLALIYKLKDAGLTWLDIQMVTPLTEQFGGKEIPRNDFLKLMYKSKNKNAVISSGDVSLRTILQDINN